MPWMKSHCSTRKRQQRFFKVMSKISDLLGKLSLFRWMTILKIAVTQMRWRWSLVERWTVWRPILTLNLEVSQKTRRITQSPTSRPGDKNIGSKIPLGWLDLTLQAMFYKAWHLLVEPRKINWNVSTIPRSMVLDQTHPKTRLPPREIASRLTLNQLPKKRRKSLKKSPAMILQVHRISSSRRQRSSKEDWTLSKATGSEMQEYGLSSHFLTIFWEPALWSTLTFQAPTTSKRLWSRCRRQLCSCLSLWLSWVTERGTCTILRLFYMYKLLKWRCPISMDKQRLILQTFRDSTRSPVSTPFYFAYMRPFLPTLYCWTWRSRSSQRRWSI